MTATVTTFTTDPAAGPTSGPERVWSGTDITPVGRHRLGSAFATGPDSASEAELIATAVLAVPGVAGLHGGAYGEIATYLPGRQVTGIRINPVDPQTDTPADPRIEVHVVAVYPAPVAALADTIRSAIAHLLGNRVIDIYVEDYAVAPEPGTDPGPVPPGT